MTTKNGYNRVKCVLAQMLQQLYISCGCVPFFHTLRPNESNICTPAHIYSCVYKGYHTVISSKIGGEKKAMVSVVLYAAPKIPMITDHSLLGHALLIGSSLCLIIQYALHSGSWDTHTTVLPKSLASPVWKSDFCSFSPSKPEKQHQTHYKLTCSPFTSLQAPVSYLKLNKTAFCINTSL